MNGLVCFFFQAEDGIRYVAVTGVQTCALPILRLLLEPLVLRLECVDRPPPELQVRRRARTCGSLLSLHRLASEDGEQGGRPEPAEQEPGHAAHPRPTQECQAQGADPTQLDPLLGEPGGAGV